MQNPARLFCCAVLLLPPSSGAAGNFTFSTGLDQETGDYGKASATDQFRIPLALRYGNGPWIVRLAAPLTAVDGVATALEREVQFAAVDVDGDGDVDEEDDESAGAGTPAPSAGASGTPPARRESGIGDAVLSVGYKLIRPSDSMPLGIDLGARAKLPVAGSENCLITNGARDYSVEATAYKPLGRFEPALTLGYTLRGDPDRRDFQCQPLGGTVELRNPFYVGIGADVQLAGPLELTGRYLFRERLREGSDPLRELRLGLQYRFSQSLSFTVFGLAGFSRASPDWGAGAGLGVRF
jgi:hypothetical protein